jgi:peptidoglycan/LPS O-acetylase OafA/YrhL
MGLSASHIPALDGMRAVAAFLVVFYHFGVPYVPGGLGVLVFFVLSGFLITWLLLEEDDAVGSVSLRKFYGRRFLRIMPAFYVYWLLFTVLVLALGKRIVWGQTVASALYVNNYYQAILGDPNTGLSHTWTLAIEEQFYLLWPLVFRTLRKDRVRLAKVLLCGILAVWAYRAVLQLWIGVDQGYIYEAFETRADHLMIGCLLAVVLRAGLFPRFWGAVCGHPLAGVGVISALTLSAEAEFVWGYGYRNSVGFLLDPVLAAILIAQLVAFSRSPVFRGLEWPWMRYLGRISYSIYLYQQLVIDPVQHLLSAAPYAFRLAGVVVTVIGAASVSYFGVERPFLRMKRAFGRLRVIRLATGIDQGHASTGSRSMPPAANPSVPTPQAFRARMR